MASLRVSEIYTSIQGEGPNTGKPTTFVRFGGCNMRCPGWPCDTMFSVDPKFRDTWDKYSALELANDVPADTHNVCITGGEPTIQPILELEEFVTELRTRGHRVEMFSNGSMPYSDFLLTKISHTMMDWKLEGSGEADSFRETRFENVKKLQETDGIKFVVKDQLDLEEALEFWEQAVNYTRAAFWVGAAWGKMKDDTIVDFILTNSLPWRLNVQVHKHIWQPDERRR